jgi:hypothetical protein
VSSSRGGSFVRLFEADPDLLGTAPQEVQSRLVGEVVVPRLQVGRGQWEPRPERGAIGVLVLEGLLRREIDLLGHVGAELLGPGDLLRPWQRLPIGPLLHRLQWRAVEPTELALIDRRAAERIGAVPEIISELLARSTARALFLHLQVGLSRIQGVSARLVFLLWAIADRWGRRERGETVVPLRLSHELLGALVSVERATASRGLKALAEAGLISRRTGGHWVLHGDPPQSVEQLVRLQDTEGGALVAEGAGAE